MRMRRLESLLISMEFTTADRASSCGSGDDHRVEVGVACLAVNSAGEKRQYCVDCARALLAQTLVQLKWLLAGAERLAE